MAKIQSDPTSADAAIYVQTNLVSDIAGLAMATDPHLVNPWGVSFMGGSPFWISDQGSNSTTLYSVTDSTVVNTPVPLFTVNIPTTATTGPQGPTGQVSNTNASSFHLTDRRRHERRLHLRRSQRDDLRLEPRPRDKRVNRARRSDDAGRRLYRIGSQRGSYDALRRQRPRPGPSTSSTVPSTRSSWATWAIMRFRPQARSRPEGSSPSM